MIELPHPWDKLDEKKLRSLFEQSLKDPVPLAGGEGCLRCVCVPDELRSLLSLYPGTEWWGVSKLLALCLPDEYHIEDDEDEDPVERMTELLERLDTRELGRDGVLLSALEGVRPRDIGYMGLCSGWNPGSRVSGTWGVSVSVGARRGYFSYDCEDYNGENYLDSRFLTAVFEPVKSEAVFREACIRLYCENYEIFTLPPALGERADGEQPLWMECLEELFRTDPHAREEMSGQMGLCESVDEERWKNVKQLTGFFEKRLMEFYRMAGFKPEDGRSNSRRGGKKFPLVVEDFSLDCDALLKDRDLLRFWTANYCHQLENEGVSGW